ncbi:translation initiation factor IF-1 [Patescibacteria group bacterium]|nr:translation initiation factor IF-1 [Patescibacteria group bacterium]MBU1246502.1 translation initiation factor IF-1 [Patescibacteria group bacterium]MBU1519319.1 translation initiation factor IF-1 [Patescibacteria group bacterium]MBU1729961.1 translation initiation factor IF-1 [Patescibacteria group bacterium]MBU1956430.1 translation initiation factor IF-1 [Patescibacteria group bacterium]
MNNKKEQEGLVTGTVVEALPNAMFRVKFENNDKLHLTYLAGKMRKYRIKVLIGDKVLVRLDPYGGKGRIERRV